MLHKFHMRQATIAATLRTAWFIYMAFVFLPLFSLTLVMHSYGAVRHVDLIEPWFLGAAAFIAVAVPGAMFLQSRLFRVYWSGGAVKPRVYLLGVLAVWITLEAGILLSLTGCLLSHALMPGVLPAIVAFVVLVVSYPVGKAMLPHGGDSDDPEFYEEPR